MSDTPKRNPWWSSNGQPIVNVPRGGIVFPFAPEDLEAMDQAMKNGTHWIKARALVKGEDGEDDRLLVEAVPRKRWG